MKKTFLKNKLIISSVAILASLLFIFVPNNVEQAADLILEDMMNEDSIYRKHGIFNADMDVLKFQTGQNFYESTGNIDADILLMDYTLFVMDYVV